MLKMCEKSGVHTRFIPDYNNVIPTKPYTEDLQGLPVINIRRVPLSDPLNKMDETRSGYIWSNCSNYSLFSPVMIVTAIMIKKTSPGPLIFSQERVGQNRPFKMYKFRSMIVQDEKKEKRKAGRPKR